ncbi:MAG: hypothetical protein AMXMBFR13_16590 [Phycisphaerae bacterium]
MEIGRPAHVVHFDQPGGWFGNKEFTKSSGQIRGGIDDDAAEVTRLYRWARQSAGLSERPDRGRRTWCEPGDGRESHCQ